MELGFLDSSNNIISGDMDEIMPDHDKVSCEIEPENIINDSDMEINEDNGKDKEEDANRKSDVRSESGYYESFDNDDTYP